MGHPPISKIAKGFRLHPSLRNEANNIDSLSQMQAKKIKKSCVAFLVFCCRTPAATRRREIEIRYRPACSTDKKKCPSAQCREAMKYVLRQQKSAPFPTRQWLHVLCFYFRCKNSFSGHSKIKPVHYRSEAFKRMAAVRLLPGSSGKGLRMNGSMHQNFLHSSGASVSHSAVRSTPGFHKNHVSLPEDWTE